MTSNAAIQHSTDLDLIAASRAGSKVAFEQLYRNHYQRIYALCWRLCGCDWHWAEDVLQETFVQAWRKLSEFRGEAALTTWLHRVAVNIVLAERRRGSARLRMASDPLPVQDITVAPGETHADHDLEAAIASLPPRARLVLVLHELHGYSHVEIADMSKMAEGTSRAQLNRARKLLKQYLHKDLACNSNGREVNQHV
ncbi:MAG: sigma-70 family RNA polymerase sigma factor [Gammaproteobacteria bacterium]|jgi:RNA polymerase sigma factor (sigma-70 family)|nr:sigma-70 family RNA polymerase sigma factor [Gammaproteobacteria bacterium]